MINSHNNNKNVKCASCGLDILDHIRITWITCLSTLSGEIEVLRKLTNGDKC